LFFSVLSSFGSSLLLPSNLTSITKVVLNHVFSILSLLIWWWIHHFLLIQLFIIFRSGGNINLFWLIDLIIN
jgi:hypothetical protein